MIESSDESEIGHKRIKEILAVTVYMWNHLWVAISEITNVENLKDIYLNKTFPSQL